MRPSDILRMVRQHGKSIGFVQVLVMDRIDQINQQRPLRFSSKEIEYMTVYSIILAGHPALSPEIQS